MQRYYFTAVLLALSTLVFRMPLAAQTIPARPASPSECTSAEAALAAGNRNGSGWERLPDCGSRGGQALAAALRAGRTDADAKYLERLYGAMSSLRDPAVFTAALEVMQDPAASPEARATAVLIAFAQHDRGLSPRLNVSFKDLISGRELNRCPLAAATDVGGYRSESALPPDYLQQLRKATDQVAESSTTPPVVRKFAKCASRSISQRTDH
jgi:hypothetical protein